MKKYNIQSKSLYNMNEKNFMIDLINKQRVICFKNEYITIIQNNNKKWIIFIECVNATKRKLHDYFLFKNKQIKKIWIDVLKFENVILMTENDWINNEIDFR